MGGLRERLAAKTRRSKSVLIQVADTTGIDTLIANDRVQLTHAEGAGDEVRLAELRAAWQARVDERTTSCFAQLELQALPAAEWEALVATYPGGDDAYLDWDQALPYALAGACVADELRDADWWAEQLAGPAWSSGQKSTLRAALLDLNLTMLPVAEAAGKD